MAERELTKISGLPAHVGAVPATMLVEGETAEGESVHLPFSALGGMPDAHASTHQHGGTDEIAVAESAANAIPKADAAGKLDGWISGGNTTRPGILQLADDDEVSASKAVNANDPRLSDARPAATHGATHTDLGTDPMPNANETNSGLMSALDKTKLDSVDSTNIPTADEKAALAGTFGTPSGSNKFVTDNDPRIGGGSYDVHDIFDWANFGDVELLSEEATGQTIHGVAGLCSYEDELYGYIANLDIYKLTGGVWVATGQTSRNWTYLRVHNEELYATEYGGDIYKMDGSGVFQPTGQTSRNWYGLASHEGELWATVYNGDIYKMDISGVMQPTGQTTRAWVAIESDDGELYASVYAGGLYKLDGSDVMVYLSDGGLTNSIRTLDSVAGRLYGCGNTPVDMQILCDDDKMRPIGLGALLWKGVAENLGVLFAATSTYAVTDSDLYTIRQVAQNWPSINLDHGAVFLPAAFPIGGQKVIRMTGTSDWGTGKGVYLYPPPGATFSGLKSIQIYGQYDSVKVERLSSAVFVTVSDKKVGELIPAAYFVQPPCCEPAVGGTRSRTEYALLFGAIGEHWGAGDGSTTFGFPNMNEASPYGIGTRDSGVTAHDVATLGQFKDDQFQGHGHRLTGRGHASGSGSRNEFGNLSEDDSNNTSVQYPVETGAYGAVRTGTVTRGKIVGVKYWVKVI